MKDLIFDRKKKSRGTSLPVLLGSPGVGEHLLLVGGRPLSPRGTSQGPSRGSAFGSWGAQIRLQRVQQAEHSIPAQLSSLRRAGVRYQYVPREWAHQPDGAPGCCQNLLSATYTVKWRNARHRNMDCQQTLESRTAWADTVYSILQRTVASTGQFGVLQTKHTQNVARIEQKFLILFV